jgi:hypothetical protein
MLCNAVRQLGIKLLPFMCTFISVKISTGTSENNVMKKKL